MRTCTHCKINVGSSSKNCPLCQSPLKGQMEETLHWPKRKQLQAMSLLLKIGLFSILAVYAVVWTVDFEFIETPHTHFSLPIFWYVLVFLLSFYWYYRSHRSVPVMLFRGMCISSLVIAFTANTYGGKYICYAILIPIIFLLVLITNFVFCFIDAGFTEDSMLCILLNIIIGIVPNIAMIIWRGTIPHLWTATFLLSIITLLAIIIFKGRLFIAEIQKRLNI